MVARYCPHCWREIGAGDTHCPACGAALNDAGRDLVLRYSDALRHREPTLACLACNMLAELGDRRAVPPLIALLDSRPRAYEVACAAAESLGALGDRAATPALWSLLQDAEVAIPARLAALRALLHFGGETARAAQVWAATSDRPSLREEAASVGGQDSQAKTPVHPVENNE